MRKRTARLPHDSWWAHDAPGFRPDDLERLLDGAKVDLVPATDLTPEIRARVEREAVPP
jgi:hypothetical protein